MWDCYSSAAKSPVTQYVTQTQHSDGGRQGDGTPAVIIIIIIIYSSRILITGL